MKSHNASFTLIELLFVIAVIAILAAMLLPALNRARAQGNRSKCAGNLRQMQSCIDQYVNDFQDFVPPRTDGGVAPERNWNMYLCAYTAVVYQYAKIGSDAGKWKTTIVRCPSYRDLNNGYCAYKNNTGFRSGQTVGTQVNLYASYRGNPNVFWLEASTRTKVDRPHKITAHRPSIAHTFADAPFAGASSIEIRHTGGCNFSFLDGHVETINFGYPDYSSGENNWGGIGVNAYNARFPYMTKYPTGAWTEGLWW